MSYVPKSSSSNFNNRRFMNEGCMLSLAVETLSARWTVQVLFCIYFDLNRFGLIKARLAGVSDQILGLRLRQLVNAKLIMKKIIDDDKIYVLTERARTLIPILEDLTQWQTKNGVIHPCKDESKR